MTRREQVILGTAVGLLAGLVARDLDLTSLVSFWGDRLVLPPLGGMAGAMLATTRFRKILYAVTAGLVALWMVVAYTPLSAALVDGLVRKDALKPSDAVLVLGSRMQTDGDPTSTQLARLFRGLELMKDGLAPRLLITELPPPFASQRPFAQAMLTRFRPDAELVDLGSTLNTHDEALLTASYMRAHGVRRLIVTTSPTHTFRGAAVLEAQGLEVLSAPCLETKFDLETLDRSEERLMSFGAIIHERLGIFAYRWRGWIK